MKHTKRWLAILLALVLTLGVMPMALAEEPAAPNTAAPTETEKKDETIAGTEKKDEEKKDETPADADKKDEEKKDETPADADKKDGEKKDETPADADKKDEEKKDETPADADKKDEEKKDETPADAGKKDEEKKDETPAAPKFTDVAATSPFAAAITWAVGKEITLGKTETTFGPADPCTVSHILTFLWRANGKPGAAEGVADRDSAAKWAQEKKMIAEGADLTATCTRSMAVTFMWQAAGSPETKTEKAFTDVKAEDAFAGAVAWAVENAITTGTTETTFAPENPCNRGQIVTFLFRQLAEKETTPAA